MSQASLEALRTYCDNIAILKDHLGPILLQFPRARRIFAGIDENDLSSSVRIALELRHKASMQDIDLLDELRHLHWCLVVHPKNIGWQQDTAYTFNIVFVLTVGIITVKR